MAGAELVHGFHQLPIKFKASSSAHHILFYKEHSVRDTSAEKPCGRTLFIINVPPYCTEDALSRIFSQCGKVEAVYFHQRPTSDLPPQENYKFFPEHEPIKGFKVAYVVFAAASGLKKAMLFNPVTPEILSTKETPIVCGLKKWTREYNQSIPNANLLQEDIDKFMEEYDKRAREIVEKDKQLTGAEGDEGWITVNRRGNKRGFKRSEEVLDKIMEIEKKKRAKKELKNFYTFQIKESKIKHIVELRQKFEEDKKRIAMLKQSRRFKPF